MAAKHSRASTLQQRRLIQIGTAAACVAFVGVAAGAVLVDRSVAPAARPQPFAPPAVGSSQGGEGAYPVSPPLMASMLSKVYTLEPVSQPDKGEEGGQTQTQPPPQEVALVAAIGQPGDMMAVIREGAAQTAIGVGQQAGSVEVLEVRPGWARVRHRGVEKELTVGQPTLLVSDMGAGPAQPGSTQIVGQPDASRMAETMEESGVTRTRMPTAMQRAQSGGNSGGAANPGGGRSSAGNRSNQGNQSAGNGNGNGNGSQAAQPGGPKRERDQSQGGQSQEDDR